MKLPRSFACLMFVLLVAAPVSSETRGAPDRMFKKVSIKEAASAINPLLVKKFYEFRPRNVFAYHLARNNHTGFYILGKTEKGWVWLVDAIVDWGLEVSMIKALAYVPQDEWDKAMTEAKNEGLPFPSPSTFSPQNIIQVFDRKPLCRGTFAGACG